MLIHDFSLSNLLFCMRLSEGHCSPAKLIPRGVAIMMQVTEVVFPAGSVLDVLCII